MKNIFILIFIFLSSYGMAQSIKNDSASVLSELQGEWEFVDMLIITDSSSFTEYYHATTMKIEGDLFVMFLSEASSFGKIEWINENAVFVFNRKYHPKDFGEEKWRNLNLISLTKSSFKVTMQNVSPYSFTNKAKGFVDIIFSYKRL